MPAAQASRGEENDLRFAAHADLALVRPVDAGQDLHDGGLARAVLADERPSPGRASATRLTSCSALTPGKLFDTPERVRMGSDTTVRRQRAA